MSTIITYLGDKLIPQKREDVEKQLGKEAVDRGIKSGFVSVSKSGKISLSKKGMDRYIAIEGARMMRGFIGH